MIAPNLTGSLAAHKFEETCGRRIDNAILNVLLMFRHSRAMSRCLMDEVHILGA